MRDLSIGSAAMDPTSRVKVEYRDPSGIYESVIGELQPRLPLKELHWSPASARPTRSISNLHIELVLEESSGRTNDPTSTEGASAPQEDGSASNRGGPRKERRHQIPGLRRTPYLRIYLLQCSDVDTYKASARKLLREWINAQSSPSKSKQENHDACEWLIIHVTSASTDESRPPSSTKSESNIEKRPSSSRWPSRSTTSLIEKIRVDFNGTSKNTVDRVVQVETSQRPTGDAKQVNRLSQDGTNGWDDLMAKLKSLILASFDLRVSQYEEDIKEKELQRNLPGWNFNTFFILKEGLARGFESVGLIEDALTGYHELAFGLKTVIDEEQNNDAPGQRTAHFSGYTEELYEAFKRARRNVEGASKASRDLERQDFDLGTSILDTDRKAFQDLILTNKISVFDFQCYVFARQVSLSLRLANAVMMQPKSTKAAAPNHTSNLSGVRSDLGPDLSKPSDTGPEDLLMLSEVIRSAAEFLTSIAHTIRDDIKTAVHESGEANMESDPSPVTEDIIGNIVSDWGFSASQCILEATSARSLSAQLDPLLRQLRSKTSTSITGPEKDAPDPINAVHRNGLPSRISSLIAQGPTKPAPLAQESFPLATSLDAVRLLPPGTSRVGAQKVAAQRGDLLALARRVLSSLGLRHGGWPGGLADAASVSIGQEDDMQDVELESDSVQDKTNTQTSPAEPHTPITAGVCNRMLLSALGSSSDFYAMYEELTTSALACYVVGDRKKAAEAMTADLAAVRFQLKDYSVAASYFRQLAPFYAKDDWSNLEIIMLGMYAQCLGHLGKVEEHVRIALRILAKTIRSTCGASKEFRIGAKRRMDTQKPISNTKMDIRDITSASQPLSQPVSVPMDQFFDGIRLDKYIRHSPELDGFGLSLRLRSLLPESFEAQTVQAKIVNTGVEQNSEIWLSADDVQMIEPGIVNISLQSNTMLPGWYTLSSIAIQSSNIIFMHDLFPTSSTPLLIRPRDSMTSRQKTITDQQHILIWPAPTSLEARLTHYQSINLEQRKSINLKIASGKNDVSQGKLLLRAASAGLRLHTAEALAEQSALTIRDQSLPGSIGFGEISAHTTACIRIPYDLENDLRDIVVRSEIRYTTPEGEFTYACDSQISITLPLAINVEDIFTKDVLFAKFTIGTASSVPVRVANCHLEGNGDFDVECCALAGAELDVFALQPLSLVSKIRRIRRGENNSDGRKPSRKKMLLHIDYRCLDDEICTAVEEVFSDALTPTPFRKYARLLKPMLLAALRTRIPMQDLEAIGLQREITLGTFDDYGWATILTGLPADLSGELAKWLRSWHEDHKTILLDGAYIISPLQQLIVPVGIPQVHVVHTARLRPFIKPESPRSDLHTLAIGQGLPMELIITHTRKWHSDSRQEADSQPLDFIYEVQANPDIWLIGGQRKAHFSARADQPMRVSLLLYPQTMGLLMYPAVEIHPVPSDSETLSETHNESQAESILVVPDRISSTISLDPSGAGGGWLVESRTRNT